MSETYTVDNLFSATQVQPLTADKGNIASGQQLKRGCVLGVDSSSTSTYSETPTFPNSDENLAVKLEDKTALTDGLTVKNGSTTYTISTDYTVAKDAETGEVTITRVALGSIAKNTKVTVSYTANYREKGYLKAVDSSASSAGYNVPYAVLGRDTDTTEGPKQAPIYLTGEFNSKALTFGGTDTVSDHAAKAREIGLIFKANI